MFFKQEINLLNDYESMPFPIHFENEVGMLLHITILFVIVIKTQLLKLFRKIVDSLRHIYQKYMIMFLRMNMI